ncbi:MULTISPECIES: threonine--tRNA ligase [Pontibacillus]|uniref:Threonine--tRNA ligase n=1 Tax=Pontibacillus chungwhensis TaxID=265426 RepID=A0ABY8UY64_9BACI|nr:MULTISPECIES: threonine--tRNA ligase [Pontibacillus]MCD5323209.1 threonine--tRNA ligase [Pontibacillus sp. HN14]WIF96596.1 threonine--tRNA ligase [Pontibacillus chungwhensis]
MNESMIYMIFPDGKEKEYPKGSTLEDIAVSISQSLKKRSVGGRVNGELYDFKRPIEEDARISLVSLDSNDGLELMRHTSAHVLAQAVKRIYGEARFGVGPVIENGFYYDIKVDHSIQKEDLLKIEKEMKKIISENLEIKREALSREEAERLFFHDPYKMELLQAIPSHEPVTVYRQGEFVDLCRGPHVPSTKWIKSFSLTSVAGAYWRGDSSQDVMQRVYGIAFASAEDKQAYENFLEEAEKRNHRKLGKELDLFMFSEEAPGMPFYLRKGQTIRNELERFLRDLQHSFDYEEVRTPMMMNQRLWEQSGHWDHYKENMYFSEVDDQRFALKPMNCPGHMLIYKDQLHSYRDLPIRMAEFGQVHRHEFSGALNGMLRVRTFCQDDAHIFVTPEQIEDEIRSCLNLIDYVYQTFGFDYSIELSTRPEDSMGDDSLWNQAENALETVLQSLGYNYTVNEGDGAFYGPKIDVHIKDALNRSHQCATVQLDFQMPEKFDLSYVDKDGQKTRPVVLHRAVFGSIDRFLGILIEHFGGAFPDWLAPVQVKVIPVSNQVHGQYAEELRDRLKHNGVRAETDFREEKLGYKVRDVQMKKIPYLLVVGDDEEQHGAVQVRQYGQEGTYKKSLEEFESDLLDRISERVL